MGDLDPHLIHDTLGPPESSIQMTCQVVHPFFAQLTAKCPYTLEWATLPPSKLLLPMGDVDPYVIHGSLSPPESSTQTASWLVQPFLQGSLVWQTDRQTTLLGSVTIGRICVCTTVMRPNKNMNCKNVQFTSKYKHRVTTLKKQISLLWVSTQSVKLNFACKVMLQISLTLHCHC